MTYLMQNVCKFIFFFPKTILFLAMLLVCERFHLYLRMDKIRSLLKIKSLTIFKVAGYFSVECMRSVEEHKQNWTETNQLFSGFLIPSVTRANHFARNLVRLYDSFSFLFCANSLVDPVLYTFRMTEFKALSLILGCKPWLRSFLTWSQANVEQRNLNKSCSKDVENILETIQNLIKTPLLK